MCGHNHTQVQYNIYLPICIGGSIAYVQTLITPLFMEVGTPSNIPRGTRPNQWGDSLIIVERKNRWGFVIRLQLTAAVDLAVCALAVGLFHACLCAHGCDTAVQTPRKKSMVIRA